MSVNAGWHDDPTGRHTLRWFDGDDWTDHVSDHGEQSEDPVLPPDQPLEQKEQVRQEEPAETGDGQAIPWFPLMVGALLVITAIAVGVFLLGRGDDNPDDQDQAQPTTQVQDQPTPTGEVAAGGLDVAGQLDSGAFSSHAVAFKLGDVVRFRVQPNNSRSDLVVGVGVTPGDARAGALQLFEIVRGTQLFDDLAAPSLTAPALAADVTDAQLEQIYADFTLANQATLTRAQIVSFADSATRGGAEADWLIIPASSTYYFYVFDFNGSAGTYDLLVETGDPVDLSRDGALAQLGIGPFFEDTAFYTTSPPEGLFDDEPNEADEPDQPIDESEEREGSEEPAKEPEEPDDG